MDQSETQYVSFHPAISVAVIGTTVAIRVAIRLRTPTAKFIFSTYDQIPGENLAKRVFYSLNTK